jgi:flagellar biosynthetic protein FliP
MKNIFLRFVLILTLFTGFSILIPHLCHALTPPAGAPYINISLGNTKPSGDVGVGIQILLVLTALSLGPAILIMLTSFTRIVIVLSILRQAIGTQQLPPNQIILGMALFLTIFVMSPVWQKVNQDALQPYLEGKVTQAEAFSKASQPLRGFMFKQTREKDLALLVDMAKIARPQNKEDVPTSVLIPSFIISELKTAFQIGFLLYVPFLVIDIVVASILLSMGMMMLPPVMIALPFKLMLFVLVDGWYLIVGSLIKSFA